MRLILFLALFCISAQGHTAVEYQEIKPGQVPQCIDKEGIARSLGEMWQDKGVCSRTRCLASAADKAIIQHHRCGQVEGNSRCEIITPNKDLPYPDCCPKLLCHPNI